MQHIAHIVMPLTTKAFAYSLILDARTRTYAFLPKKKKTYER